MADALYKISIEGAGFRGEVQIGEEAAAMLITQVFALAAGDPAWVGRHSLPFGLASPRPAGMLVGLGRLPSDLTYCGKVVTILERATQGGTSSLDRQSLRDGFREAGWGEPMNWWRELRIGIARGYLVEVSGRFSLTEKGRQEAGEGFRTLRAGRKTAGF